MIYQYDGSNDKCPLHLVTVRVQLKTLKQGDEYIVLLKDKGSKTDIPKYLMAKGYDVVSREYAPQVIELTIKKGSCL